MKTRLLSILIVCLLSLGLVTALLAAAGARASARPAPGALEPGAPEPGAPAAPAQRPPYPARVQPYAPRPVNLPGSDTSLAVAGELHMAINYTHDNVVVWGDPNMNVTITVEGKATQTGQTNENGELWGWEWPWDPFHPDIQPGDRVTATGGGLTAVIDPVGSITGRVEADADRISGQIFAPFGSTPLNVECSIWVEDGPPSIQVGSVAADGGSYTCDFAAASGFDIKPGMDVAVAYYEPDGDGVVSVFQSPWMSVNEAHNWVGGVYPAGHTFTIRVTDGAGVEKATAEVDTVTGGHWGLDGFQTAWENWTPEEPDIQAGDWVYYSSDDGYTNSIRVGAISGEVDVAADQVSGAVQAGWLSGLLPIECHPWGAPGGAPVKFSSAGAAGSPPYACQWDAATEWDVQLGQDIAVMYLEPDGDRVMTVLQKPDPNLYLRVNYGHDWIESFYFEIGHTVWITVTESDGQSVKATAEGQTGEIPWWGGETGFQTGYNVLWDVAQPPDIQPGDWVYGRLDTGYSAAVQIGEINGQIDLAADRVSGDIHAAWFSEDLPVECHTWGAPGPAPMKYSSAGPDGSPPYSCQWDPASEWDLLAGQDVGVAYFGPDGHWVANALRAPAPHLWIDTWADGNPATGNNFAFYVRFNNDGEAVAEDATISSVLSAGLTYLGDTSGLAHSGAGTAGDPLVWQLGDLPADNAETEFQVFVSVSAPLSSDVSHTVRIATTTPYAQGDEDRKQSEWQGKVAANDTYLNIGKHPWTWDPVPGYEFVYQVDVCNNGSTASSVVTVTDDLPAETTLLEWWGQEPGWVPVSSQAHRLVVQHPSIGAWRCSQVYLRVHLAAGLPPETELVNTATLSSSSDLSPDDNQADVHHGLGSPHRNLSLHRGWLAGQFVPGGEISYEADINNNGNIPVNSVVMTSTLPAHTTFLAAWYYDGMGRHPFPPAEVVPGEYLVWEFPKIDNGFGAHFSIDLRVDADAPVGASLVHTIDVPHLDGEDDYDDNHIAWIDTLNPSGLNLRVNAREYKWQDDQVLNFTVFLHNTGTQPLENFTVRDSIPDLTDFEGDWNVNHGGYYTLTVDTIHEQLIFWGERLEPGQTASLGFRVRLDPAVAGQPGHTFTNMVWGAQPGDVTPADNNDQVTAFSGPDLWVMKSLVSGEALPGHEVTYSLRFGNSHSDGAHWWNLQGAAWLTDTLPAQVEFVSAKLLYCGPEWWCNFDPVVVDGQTLTWELWPLGSGAHNEIQVTVRVADTVNGLDTLLNQVEIASDQPQVDIEPDAANNAASYELPVALPHFMVSKTFSSSRVAGMPVSYTLTVQNNGHVAGTQVVVRDSLPAGVTYLNGGSFQSGVVSLTLAQVGPGQSAADSFSVALKCDAVGQTITNQEYAVTGSAQGVTSANGAPVSFTVLAPTISVTAGASADPVLVGESVHFTAVGNTNGTPLTYTWKLGATEIGAGAALDYAFTQPGSYEVTVTATDGCGFTSSAKVTVTVHRQLTYLPVVMKGKN